jgi:ABC-transporter N-terminal
MSYTKRLMLMIYNICHPIYLINIDIYGYRMGVEATEVEVRFENLTVEAETQVGGQPLPTLINATLNGIQVRELDAMYCYS